MNGKIRNILVSLRLALCASLCCFAASCVEYHPYDTRIKGDKNINAANAARIESACAGRRSIRFAVISDSQRWYDETEDAVAALNARGDLDFVVHTGDLADFGLRTEFELQRDILNKLDVPYVCVIGNHDCLGTGEIIFREIFGDYNMAFTAGDVRFLCLNTNALEFDAREAVPNFGFITSQLEAFPSDAGKTVAVMHSQPFSEQFNNDVADIFQRHLRAFPSLQFCVHGHSHSVTAEELFSDGVVYYQCANTGDRSYLLFTVGEDGYDYEAVYF